MIVFRAGWLAKKLHSAFDYIFNSMLKDEKCGKGLADWDEEDGLKHEGGYSPNFYAIATEVEKAEMFVDMLFFRQQKHVSKEVCRILFASLLRFYEDFENVLENEPTGKFEHNVHPLTAEITKSMQDVNVSEELFKIWQEEIKKDFVSKNYLALPMSEIPQDIRVDVRTPLLCLRKVEQSSSASYSTNAETQTEVRHLREEVKMLMNTVSNLVDVVKKQDEKIDWLVQERKQKKLKLSNDMENTQDISCVNISDENTTNQSIVEENENLPTWETVSKILKKKQVGRISL